MSSTSGALRTVASVSTISAILLGSLFSTGAASASEPAITPPATVSAFVTAAPAAPEVQAPVVTYKVKAGDSLWAIAQGHEITLDNVFTWNNLSEDSVIQPGQSIKLSSPVAVKPAATATTPSSLFSLKVTENPTPKKAATKKAAQPTTHKVVAGDTAGAIAKKYGIPLDSVLAWNGLHANSVIFIDRTLKLTGAANAKPAPAPVAKAPAASVPAAHEGALTTGASVAQVKTAVADTARSMGVDPALALAIAEQESGFRAVATSSVGAKGTMQVMPANQEWVSGLVGRPINLDVPADNIAAGVAMLRQLVATSPSLDIAIASYYQGQHGVMSRGMFEDTKVYLAQVKARMATFQ